MEIKNPTEMLALCILIVVFVHFVGSLAGLLVEFPPPQKYVEIRRIFSLLTILIPCRTFPLIYFCRADVTCNFLQRDFLKQEN